MPRRIVFWGAEGHARVLRELCDRQGINLVALFDNNPKAVSPFDGVPIFYGQEGFLRWRSAVGSKDISCLVAIGGARGRDRIASQRFMAEHGVPPAVGVHPAAFVARDAVIGPGSQLLAQSAICAASVLGDACIINTIWEDFIMNPLETIQGTVIAGVVLAVILAIAAKAIAGA